MHNQISLLPASDQALQDLQQNFVISYIGGQIRILNRNTISKLLAGKKNVKIEYIQKRDSELMMRRHIEASSIAAEKPREIINDFFICPKTHVYEYLNFHPNKQSNEVLNLWIPPTIKPVTGNWAIIEDFIFDVICSGDKNLNIYIIKYLAHAIQHPEEKPGVMIVLLGDEGIGKGFFVRLLEAIWGYTTIQVSDINDVAGNFNKCLETAFWVALDEALFKGDKKSQDRMKSLVTEPRIQVCEKFEPKRTIDSFHRFIACTNHDQWGQIRSDDRRYLFVRVSNCQKQNHEYFSRLDSALNNGNSVSAFADYLYNLDITDFNPREKPKTNESFEQRRQSLSGFSRYWFEVLDQEDFKLGKQELIPSLAYDDEVFITTNDLLQYYRGYDPISERFESLQASSIKKKINEICPSANTEKREDNKRGIGFPGIGTARDEFDKWIGYKVPWST
jgi:hypothetical protein